MDKQQSAFGPLTNCPFASPESAPERELRQGCDYRWNLYAIRKCLKSIFALVTPVYSSNA
jgi:hypothetical protein